MGRSSSLLATVLVATSCGRIGFDGFEAELDAAADADEPKVFAFDQVEPVADIPRSTDPELSADGRELIVRDVAANGLLAATRPTPQDPWGTVRELAELETPIVADPQLSIDRLTLWGSTEGDIFVTERLGIAELWQPLSLVASLATAQNEFGLSVDETALYGLVAVGATGGSDQTSIFEVRRSSLSADWQLIGPVSEINSNRFDGNPTLSSDGLIVMFDTTRDGGEGRTIYAATRTRTDEPFRSPTMVSGLGGEASNPSINSDATVLYFSSDRSGQSLIYRAQR